MILFLTSSLLIRFFSLDYVQVEEVYRFLIYNRKESSDFGPFEPSQFALNNF